MRQRGTASPYDPTRRRRPASIRDHLEGLKAAVHPSLAQPFKLDGKEGLGFRENGKENGSYYSILGLYRDNGKENGRYYSILMFYGLHACVCICVNKYLVRLKRRYARLHFHSYCTTFTGVAVMLNPKPLPMLSWEFGRG